MGMENFGLNKKEETPLTSTEKVENGEMGSENLEDQIEGEVNKLKDSIVQIEAALELVGGQKGLEEKMAKMSPEKQSIIKGIIDRAKKLSDDLIKFAAKGGIVVGGIVGFGAFIATRDPLFGPSVGEAIAATSIATGVGALVYSSRTMLRIFDKNYNEDVERELGDKSGKIWEENKRKADEASAKKSFEARKNSGEWQGYTYE